MKREMGKGESSTRLIAARFPTVVQFFTVQGLTLIGNLVYGLLCVRLLPATEYAKFVVLFGVLGTLAVLTDVNFSSSLIPLIGERVEDRRLIADYVASLRQLSYGLFAVMSVVVVIAYPQLVKNRGWDWRTICAMVAILLVACWFIRISASYGAVLILLRDRPSWYRGQMISSLGTLALLGSLWLCGWLNGLTAILLNVAGIIFVGIFYFLRGRRLLGAPGLGSAEKRRAIVRLALPNIPQAIFYALQGQISLFLIAIFGHTTAVASVGALSRLGQMFAIFMQMNPLLVAPYFSRLPRERVARSYFVALLAAGAGCLSLSLIAWRFSQLFLWVLGPQYQGLHTEVLLVITAAAVACVSDLLWTIHAARRFVYWANNLVNILGILAVQILFISKADLSSIRAVLWLSLASNIVTFSVNAGTGIYGFLRGPRAVEEPAEKVPETEREAGAYLEQVEMLDFGPNGHRSGKPVEHDRV
jgi:O-antigen/teichoic acid export membrane protein